MQAPPLAAQAAEFKKERKGFGPGGEGRGASRLTRPAVSEGGAKCVHAAASATGTAAAAIGRSRPGSPSATRADPRELEYGEFFAAMDALSGPALRRGAIPRIIHKVSDAAFSGGEAARSERRVGWGAIAKEGTRKPS